MQTVTIDELWVKVIPSGHCDLIYSGCILDVIVIIVNTSVFCCSLDTFNMSTSYQ